MRKEREKTPWILPHVIHITLAPIPSSSILRDGFSLGVLGACVVSVSYESSFMAGVTWGQGWERKKRKNADSPHILLLTGPHVSILWLERWAPLGCLVSMPTA